MEDDEFAARITPEGLEGVAGRELGNCGLYVVFPRELDLVTGLSDTGVVA